eukprot:2327756-Pyramimonas_sp.AAC.1
MDSSQLWHCFGARKYLGGELNSPVAKRLNRGLTTAWGPTCRANLTPIMVSTPPMQSISHSAEPIRRQVGSVA